MLETFTFTDLCWCKQVKIVKRKYTFDGSQEHKTKALIQL